jgi:hypothetical protein
MSPLDPTMVLIEVDLNHVKYDIYGHSGRGGMWIWEKEDNYTRELSIHDCISEQQVNTHLMRVFTSFPWA